MLVDRQSFSNIPSIAGAVLMFGIGVAALYFGVRALQRAPAFLLRTIGARLVSHRWPAVSGTIIGAEIRVTPDSDQRSFYEAVVRYAYTVQGWRYEASQADMTLVSSSRDLAQAVIARYPVGSSVSVYYDPQEPQRALIDRSIRPHHLVGLLLAGLVIPLLLAGGLLAILTGLALLVAPGLPSPG